MNHFEKVHNLTLKIPRHIKMSYIEKFIDTKSKYWVLWSTQLQSSPHFFNTAHEQHFFSRNKALIVRQKSRNCDSCWAKSFVSTKNLLGFCNSPARKTASPKCSQDMIWLIDFVYMYVGWSFHMYGLRDAFEWIKCIWIKICF